MESSIISSSADTSAAPDGAANTSKKVDSSMRRPSFLVGKLLKLAKERVSVGCLTIVTPDGHRTRVGNEGATPKATWHIHNDKAVRRILSRGALGFAEGFLNGDWEANDLAAFLHLMAENFDNLVSGETKGNRVMAMLTRFQHVLNKNTRKGSRKNILAHYDLGNAFYEQWLDPSMTYSSAFWDRHKKANLQTAQSQKYTRIANEISLKPGQSVLEIGCGWGGFAELAAGEFGGHVTGLTISDEQHDYAVQRLEAKGLGNQTSIQLTDYRDVEGEFDHIVSIEMFEAVGQEFWDAYFSTVYDRLKPGGKACLQIITIEEAHFDSYTSGSADFIQHYIFPGGLLPTVTHLRTLTQKHGLNWENQKMFGLDYADTLAAWAISFEKSWESIVPMGFDEAFRRMWLYYLAYCEAGYRSKRIDVGQFTLSKPA